MSEEGARIMREAADNAVEAAKDIIIKRVEEAIPDDNPAATMRQIGAMITATTELYGAMLMTCLSMQEADEAKGRDTGQKIVNLAAGMFATMVGEHLAKMLNQADDDGSFAVIVVTEDGHGQS